MNRNEIMVKLAGVVGSAVGTFATGVLLVIGVLAGLRIFSRLFG
jgi:hypothetical protein